MKISLNWLKTIIDIPDEITPEKLAEDLTLKTVEVEGIERKGENLEGVVVGQIKSVKNHLDADNLKICQVDIGENGLKQVVCGGINLFENMFVAVAKLGARVKWHGQGDLVEIKKTKIRGIDSEGMICAASEIGLEDLFSAESEKEIIDLEKTSFTPPLLSEEGLGEVCLSEDDKKDANRFRNLEAGNSLADFLGLNDVIIDIDNKSLTNRPDLWGHIGIAREVAAIFGLKTKIAGLPRSIFFQLANNTPRNDKIEIKVESSKLCPRYMAVAMSGIKIEPSPMWMQERLLAIGMRPINNIVDITNFVMLETGQPMHAFNQSSIINEQLSIRNAREGEKIITLDGVERELDENMLVIADSEKPIAIAGIMGGANSEIDENTTEIILEAANFEKVSSRKTASKLGLRTEASMRYEKGLDPNLAELALARCIELIKQIIPNAEISSEIADIKNFSNNSFVVEISKEFINKKIGIEIKKEKIEEILKSLGFEVNFSSSRRGELKGGEEILKVKIPSWRATGDIEIPEDIVEEIARIYGYNSIDLKMPEVFIDVQKEDKELNVIKKIKEILSMGSGMSEVCNYAFVSAKQIEDLGMETEKHIKIANPLSKEQEFLRSNLAISLIKNAKENLRYFDKFKIFEIG
ncbi:MAG: phenylalanine--tRNA ligase subunit beta, partial [bacterium]